MKIPQFLYVPSISVTSDARIVLETREQIYWQVFEFANEEEKAQWFQDNQLRPCNIHAKYLFGFLLLSMGNAAPQRALTLTNRALKWYAQHHFQNKPQRPSSNETELGKKYFHWLWGENHLREDEPNYLINLEHSVSIRFDYADALGVSFEQFRNKIADVQFLSGRRPEPQRVEDILIEAWNYLCHEENLLDETNFDL